MTNWNVNSTYGKFAAMDKTENMKLFCSSGDGAMLEVSENAVGDIQLKITLDAHSDPVYHFLTPLDADALIIKFQAIRSYQKAKEQLQEHMHECLKKRGLEE